MALTELIPTDGPDSNGNMNWRAMNATQYPSYYMEFIVLFNWCA